MVKDDRSSCRCFTNQGSEIQDIDNGLCVARATGRYEFNPYSGDALSGRIASANIGETVKTGQVAIN